MSQPPGPGPGAGAEPEDLEEVLARCIDAYATGGQSAVEEVLAAHPHLDERLRERLASLERLGLLLDERALHSFGPYKVLRRLGQGGMSDVFLVWDERLGRRVALKALTVAMGGDERARTRFAHEIQAVATLRHPSIVPIFDVGEAHGRPFFTMEHVEGATLAQLVESLRVQGGAFSERTGDDVRRLVTDLERSCSGEDPAQAGESSWPRTWTETLCTWVLDVANALAHAHAAGIVHRDVKPSNVMVGLDGRARLFDLGLARLADRPGLTRSGDFTGTPSSVAPEQLLGHQSAVDERSDVFSLGGTLYELLTLRRPFEGRTTAEVFHQIVSVDPIPPRRLEPAIPPDLETICLTALQKAPAHRYQSMVDFADDVQRLLSFTPVQARPVGGARRAIRVLRRRPALAAAAVLALVVIVGLPVGLFWANRAIAAQRDLAQDHADEATRQAELSARVTDFLVELFLLTPGEEGRADTVTAREILDRGAARLPTGFEDQLLVRAALMRATGLVYRNLGLHDQALRLLDRAYAILQWERAPDHPETASLLAELAGLHAAVGNEDDARSLYRGAVQSFRRAEAEGHDLALQGWVALAGLARDATEREEAREGLEVVLALTEAPSARRAEVLEALGLLAAADGDLTGAREHLERSLATRRDLWVPAPSDLARGMDALAGVLTDLGDDRAAAELAAQARALRAASRAGRPTAMPSDEGGFPGGMGPTLVDTGPFALRPPWRAAFDAEFQAGVTALQAGRHDDSARSFAACLTLDGDHPVAAYNLACARALGGRVDEALEAIERAARLGFGYFVDGPSVLGKDPDLARAREDPRFARILEDILRRRQDAAAYASTPAVHVPEGLARGEPAPLLVVLHANGSSKDDVVAGPWRTVADELGMVLLAPSARMPVGPERPRAMRWFRDVDEYAEQPGDVDAPVLDALRAALDDLDVDRRQVVIAGEGLGALVAADVAFSAPGLFGGLVVVDGPVLPALAGEGARVASSLGMGVAVLHDPDGRGPGRPEGIEGTAFVGVVASWLASWGLDAEAVEVPGTSPSAARAAAVRHLQTRAPRRP